MTTIVGKIASIESSSNPNVKTQGSLDVTPEKIVFKPEDQETGDYSSGFDTRVKTQVKKYERRRLEKTMPKLAVVFLAGKFFSSRICFILRIF